MDSTSRAHHRLEHVANFLLTGTSAPVRIPPNRRQENPATDSSPQIEACLSAEAVICEHLAARGYEAFTRYLHHAAMTTGPISLIAADPLTVEIKNLLGPAGPNTAAAPETELPGDVDLGTVLQHLSNQNSRLIVQLAGIEEPAIVALAAQCRRISVMVEPGQSTLIEAYKIIKQLAAACDVEFGIIVCNHNDEQSAQETFQRLRGITAQFLQTELGDHGRVPNGPWIAEKTVAVFTTKTEKGLGVHSQLLGRLGEFLASQTTTPISDHQEDVAETAPPISEAKCEPAPDAPDGKTGRWVEISEQAPRDLDAMVSCFLADPPAPFERLLSLSSAARSPGHPTVAVAVNALGQLHCVGTDVMQICEVLGWVNDHRALLGLAHPQITFSDRLPAAVIISAEHQPSISSVLNMLKSDVHWVRAHRLSHGEQHGIFFETAGFAIS